MSQKYFRKKEWRCRAGVRDQAKARTQFGPDIALATFDFEDDASFPAALKGVEKIFLLPPLMPNQVAVTNAFIDETKRAGVRHIVKLSVIGADTDPPYTLENGTPPLIDTFANQVSRSHFCGRIPSCKIS